MAFPNTPSQKTPKDALKAKPQEEGKFGASMKGKKMNAKAMAQAMRVHKAEATENDEKLMAGYSPGHGMGSG